MKKKQCVILLALILALSASLLGCEDKSEINVKTGNTEAKGAGKGTENAGEGAGDGTENAGDGAGKGAEDVFHENWTGLIPGKDAAIDEDAFVSDLDSAKLEEIASKLQKLVTDISAKQEQDPDSVLRGDWTNDVVNSDEYQSVLSLSQHALKPLYYIIYKSKNQGLYEYICAMALEKISDIHFQEDDGTNQWSTSKEYLVLFHDKVLKDKEY